MNLSLGKRLDDFVADLHLRKGNVAVSLLVTEHARQSGLPLDADRLVTDSGTSVKGAGVASTQRVLKRHGITTIFARAGGRTNPGSVAHMRRFVSLLNDLHGEGLADLDAIESFWVDRVRDLLAAKPMWFGVDPTVSPRAAKPMRFRVGPTVSLRAAIRDLFSLAVERQHGVVGSTVAGAMMQHLVGAQLARAIHPDAIEHRRYSTAGAPTSRKGDFEIGDTVVHVTTSPTGAVIARCRTNLDEGLRPVLITVSKMVEVAACLAEDASMADRIDIFDIEQFVALDLYEWRGFRTADGRRAVEGLVSEYNRIVDEVETDPGLRIVLG